MKWPANSPDLSPIENAQAIVEGKMKKIKLNSVLEFSTALRSEWLRLEQEVCKNLVQTMSKRVK